MQAVGAHAGNDTLQKDDGQVKGNVVQPYVDANSMVHAFRASVSDICIVLVKGINKVVILSGPTDNLHAGKIESSKPTSVVKRSFRNLDTFFDSFKILSKSQQSVYCINFDDETTTIVTAASEREKKRGGDAATTTVCATDLFQGVSSIVESTSIHTLSDEMFNVIW
jgi:hypothetical protein